MFVFIGLSFLICASSASAAEVSVGPASTFSPPDKATNCAFIWSHCRSRLGEVVDIQGNTVVLRGNIPDMCIISFDKSGCTASGKKWNCKIVPNPTAAPFAGAETCAGKLYTAIDIYVDPITITKCAEAFDKAVIFSDWDDTISCAGGGMTGHIAGKDRSCDHGKVYPGVLQLYHEVGGQYILLSANPVSSADSKNAKAAEKPKESKRAMVAAFVTKAVSNAACKGDKGASAPEETEVPDMIDGLDDVANQGQQAIAVIYFGGAANAAFTQMGALKGRGDYSSFAADKISALITENGEPIAKLRLNDANGQPRKTIFFGDNGQGDLVAAWAAMKANSLDYGMIRIGTKTPKHKVDVAPGTPAGSPMDVLCDPANPPAGQGCIFLYKNYLQAGHIMSKLGFAGIDQAWFDSVYQPMFCADLPRMVKTGDDDYWNPANTANDFEGMFEKKENQDKFSSWMEQLNTLQCGGAASASASGAAAQRSQLEIGSSPFVQNNLLYASLSIVCLVALFYTYSQQNAQKNVDLSSLLIHNEEL